MTLHPELPDRGGVVLADLFLLGVVADAHTNVLVAGQAPDRVRELEADDENALCLELGGSLSEGVLAHIGIDARVLLGVKVRRNVLVRGLAIRHLFFLDFGKMRYFKIEILKMEILNMVRMSIFNWNSINVHWSVVPRWNPSLNER